MGENPQTKKPRIGDWRFVGEGTQNEQILRPLIPISWHDYISVAGPPSTSVSKVVANFSRRYGISSLSPEKSHDGVGGGSACLIECLPQPILHEILSQLSVCDLLQAQLVCVAWQSMISSCRMFQKLYDERNTERWIALSRRCLHQHADGFALFNISSSQWSFVPLSGDWIGSAWHLEAAADGLVLLVGKEGRLAVANPLTRRVRTLPDARLSPRLRLESCLKQHRLCARSQARPLMEICVDSDAMSFRVIVLGEFRKKQIHVLVYSSEANSWDIHFTPEIDYKLFKRLSQSTLHGNTIYSISIDRRYLVSYSLENKLFLVQEISRLEYPQLTWSGERVMPIRVVGYGSRVLVLGIVSGSLGGPRWKPFTVVAVWESNKRPDEWSLLSFSPIEWIQQICSSFAPTDVAAAYDGENSVWVILRHCAKMMSLNLDSKKWEMWPGNPEEIRPHFPGNGKNLHDQRKAFSMKLKFSSAI